MRDKLRGLRLVLARNRLMQKHVAEALGVSRNAVGAWMDGSATPSGINLLRLVEYLRRFEPSVQIEDLFEVPVRVVDPEPNRPDAA